MALISCNECGGMVSDMAKVCPHCGSPVSTAGEAYIEVISYGKSFTLTIYQGYDRVWKGKSGQVCVLKLNGPVELNFEGNNIKSITATVYPGQRYGYIAKESFFGLTDEFVRLV